MRVKLPRITQVSEHVYLVTFKTANDAGMTFLRYQEFYESPRWKDKLFTLDEYIKWYSQSIGKGSFTYPQDYNGYNIPSEVIQRVTAGLKEHKYDAVTQHDLLMSKIYDTISSSRNHSAFYLIGVSKETGDIETIKHEIAHGMYTTDDLYRSKVNKMVNDLPQSIRVKLFTALKKKQYNKSVFVDEANAFLSTGLSAWFGLTGMNQYRSKFRKVFNTFYKRNGCTPCQLS